MARVSNITGGGWLRFLILGAMGIIAFVAVFVATPHGIGVSPDSTKYIGAARNLAEGNGYSFAGAPLTHFPPLYPGVLAGAGFLGVDAHAVARAVSALVFAGLVLLSGHVLHRYTRGSVFWTLLAAVFTLAAGPLWHIHLHAWSEPLFILLAVGGLYLLTLYFGGRTRAYLVAAGVLLAAAFLTRYVGAALIGAGVLCILLFGRGNWRRRGVDVAILLLVSCLPMGAWALRNSAVAGTAANRRFAVHPVTTKDAKDAARVLSWWTIPMGGAAEEPEALRKREGDTLDRGESAQGEVIETQPAAVRKKPRGKRKGSPWLSRETRIFILFPVFTALLAVALARRRRPDSAEQGTPPGPPVGSEELRRLPAVLLIFAASFFGFLLVSMSFFDAMTQMVERILSPVCLPILLACLCLAHDSMRRPWHRLAHPALLAGLGLCCLTANATRSANLIEESRSRGLGYVSERYRGLPLVERIRALPAETIIYSNSIELVSFLARRDAVLFPSSVDLVTELPNVAFEQEMAAMLEALRSGRAVAVEFAGRDKAHAVTVADIGQKVELAPLYQSADGGVYAVKNRAAGATRPTGP